MMSETKAIRIASVKYEREYSLRIRWVNGKTMSVDLQEPVSRLKGMRAIRDKEALDLSRRQVAYYASGERPVPRYVLLALKGWEVEHEEAAA
jgi:hypothetical protein